MKKVILGLICFVMFVGVSFGKVEAATTSVQWLSEAEEFSIWLPEDYDVFYLGMKEDDPLFAKYGISHASQQANMKSMTVDLDAWAPDGTLNIQILSDVNPGESFLNSSDEQLLGYLDSHFAWVYSEMGMEYLGCEIYLNSQEKFFKSFSKFESNGKTIYGVWYFTGHGERSYSVKFYGYNGEFSEEQLNGFDEVVDGMYMGKVVAPSVETEPTPEVLEEDVQEEVQEKPVLPTFTYHTYKTRDGRASFPIADTWSLRYEKDEEIAFEDAETKEIIMEYSRIDLVKEQSYKDSFEPYYRLFMPRSELDFEYIPAKVAASVLGSIESDLEHVVNGDLNYYYCEEAYNTVTAGHDKEVYELKFLFIQNGYGHLFTFNGNTNSDPRIYAFVQTIAGAQYPELEADNEVPMYIPIGLGALILVGLIISFIKMATYVNFIKRWIEKRRRDRVF